MDTTNRDLPWPFGNIDELDEVDIRETAYEVFFTSCRSSPGFGGRSVLSFNSNNHNHGGNGSGENGGIGSSLGPASSGNLGGRVGNGSVVVMSPTSKIKRALGLKMLKRSPSRRMNTHGSSGGNGGGSAPGSPSAPQIRGGGSNPGMGFSTLPAPRPRRPLTSAEIMRLQMRVAEQSDNRLRKTLMRTLVGQAGRRAETIILPLELLRHLKPSEFNDMHEYHLWQRRQLKILEVGLLLCPSFQLEKSNFHAVRLREVIQASETKPIDTGKNSEAMKTLCSSVVSLSWRSYENVPAEVCHWADGYPLNVHLYISLLESVFDFRNETLILDEVDELMELMKKTWSTLGISRPIHNLCFTWVLFHQYVSTVQSEPDLLYAAHTMLSTEVANDAKKPDREAVYVKILCSMLDSVQGWAERRLLHYHDFFQKGSVVLMENLLPLALSASRILGEDVTITEGAGKEKGDTKIVDSSGDRVGHYIRASIKNAFDKILENGSYDSTNPEVKDGASKAMLQLAKETEDLALRERETFSPILKKWHTVASSIAAVTLQQCYGAVLKQYLSGTSKITSDTVAVLESAGKLEKLLVQMVVEDTAESEDGGKAIVREMSPYEVDSVILRLTRKWIEEKLKRGRESVARARESETWNPKTKNDPYAHSVTELAGIAKEAVDEFFEIPIGMANELVWDLAEGFDRIFQEYSKFIAACGSKQSYVPMLPPLTRCSSHDSTFFNMCEKANLCAMSIQDVHQNEQSEAHHLRPTTSRGTQRLYIRLNTLHYLLSHINLLDKTLALTSRTSSSHARQGNSRRRRTNGASSTTFELTRAAIQSACQHVSEVAAYRLIFLDSSCFFYDAVYVGEVEKARIKSALRTLKQNLGVLGAILLDQAQAQAMKEVMKASFEAFLMVLLAGGCSRVFYRTDQQLIEEDFQSLKCIFCTFGEGLISEDVVDREALVVEGVIALMGECTEQLIEDFSIVTCEASGVGAMSSAQRLPMPPTTGKWNRADPNTILRVLCHRHDRTANHFLKKTFQLAKRR